MNAPPTAESSALQTLQTPLSRKQVLILDGLRYAAEMTRVSYERLSILLQNLAQVGEQPSFSSSAEALQCAWAVVDSVNRYRDLLANLPGLRKEPWTRLLSERTKLAAELRDCVQHQLGELDQLVSDAGQVWGFISWAEVNGQATGRWFMLSCGSYFVGDQWVFAGPSRLPFYVPIDRIRINAFGRRVYLWTLSNAVSQATLELERNVANGLVRLVGEATTNRRGADLMSWATIEVVVPVVK